MSKTKVKKHDLRNNAHGPKVSITPPENENVDEKENLKSDGAPLNTPDNAVEGQTTKM